MEKSFITAQEAAEMLNVSVWTVFEYLEKGHLRGQKVWRGWQIEIESVLGCSAKTRKKQKYDKTDEEYYAEFRVLRSRGAKRAEIAEKLGLNPRTVKDMIKGIRRWAKFHDPKISEAYSSARLDSDNFSTTKKKTSREYHLQGFPKEEKFTCAADVESYLSGEYLQCLECGRKYKWLKPHLVKMHGLSEAQYRERYGIPKGYSLVGAESRKALAERLDNRIKSGAFVAGHSMHRWGKEDFDLVIERIREKQLPSTVICQDLDLPSYSSFRERCRTDRALAKKVDAAHAELPYEVQALYEILSPEFTAKVKHMHRDQKFELREIARRLGVSPMTVSHHVYGKEYSKRLKDGQDKKWTPQPGFPQTEKFTTYKQIYDYLSVETPVCLLCGREYRGLYRHVINAHHMSVRDYKDMFGLPYMYGLVGVETSKMLSAHGTKLMANKEFRFLILSALEIAKKSGARLPQEKIRSVETVPAFMEFYIANAQKTVESEKHISKVAKNKVTTYCFVCRAKTTISEMSMLTNKRKLCANCKKTRQHAATKAWSTKNKERRYEYSQAHYQMMRTGNLEPMIAYVAKYPDRFKLLNDLQLKRAERQCKAKSAKTDKPE